MCVFAHSFCAWREHWRSIGQTKPETRSFWRIETHAWQPSHQAASRNSTRKFPMKTIFSIAGLCLSIFCISAVAQNPTSARGCVVHRSASHSTANMDEYTAYRGGANFTVADMAGNLLSIFQSENPIFIPYPSDPSATREQARAQIERARKSYPEFGRRLDLIEKAWVADPRPKAANLPPPPAFRPAPPEKKP